MSLRIDIPKPCHENWDAMQPNKDGRHCMSCQKTVVDFSLMTDKEILDYISNANGEICGRVDTHQLNRDIKELNPRKRFSFIYIWNLLLLLFVFSGKAKAQGGIKFKNLTTVKKEPLNIKNAMTGEPVPFASVMVKGTANGVSSDSAGKFSMESFVTGSLLEISSAGFEPVIIKSDKNLQEINLSPVTKELDKVVVVGYGAIRCYSLMGAIGTKVRKSIPEKIYEWLPQKNIVVFPNPTNAGSNVQVALQLKEKGEYRLDLIDASGRVMWMRTMNLIEPKYNLSIPTESKWSAGIYWLRITGRHTKKIYNGKIILQ